jgi:hypothetical protein
MGTSGFFPGVKRPGREADHSPPFSVEVKNTWSYTSAPSIRLHGVSTFNHHHFHYSSQSQYVALYL